MNEILKIMFYFIFLFALVMLFAYLSQASCREPATKMENQYYSMPANPVWCR